MTTDAPDNLKHAVFRGIAWKMVAEAIAQSTRIVVLLVLARFLTPTDFGVAGIVLAFVLFVPVLADLGLGASLIQRETVTEVERSTMFWASISLGVFFTLLGIGLSWPLAAFYDVPRLQTLFSAFSICFLIASLSSVPNALLMRDMDFKSLQLRAMASTISGGATGITLALLGAGPWAIVGGELVSRVVSLFAIWSRCRWRPSLVFSWRTLKGLLAYGSSLLGIHLLMQFAQTVQNLLVGRFLGPHELGRLTMTQTLVYLPVSRIAAPIEEVTFPAFSQLQNARERLLRGWIRTNKVAVGLALPLLSGLAILAPEFTQVVLGDKWIGLENLIRAFAVTGVAVTLQRLAVNVLAALAYSRVLIWIGVAALGSTILAVAAGYRWGLTATAIALSMQGVAIQLATMRVAAVAAGARLRDVLQPLARLTVAASVMAIVVLGASVSLESVGVAPAAKLVACVLIGGAAYVSLVWMLEPDLILEIAGFFRRRRSAVAAK